MYTPCHTSGNRKESNASCTGVRRAKLLLTKQMLYSAHIMRNVVITVSTERQVNKGLYEKSTMGSLLIGGRAIDKILLARATRTSILPKGGSGAARGHCAQGLQPELRARAPASRASFVFFGCPRAANCKRGQQKIGWAFGCVFDRVWNVASGLPWFPRNSASRS